MYEAIKELDHYTDILREVQMQLEKMKLKHSRINMYYCNLPDDCIKCYLLLMKTYISEAIMISSVILEILGHKSSSLTLLGLKFFISNESSIIFCLAFEFQATLPSNTILDVSESFKNAHCSNLLS